MVFDLGGDEEREVTFGDKNVAAGKTVTLSSSNGGADVGNYAITNQGTTTASITPKALAVSGATADDKVYDGNTVAGVNTGGATITGIVSGDTVNIAGAFDTKNVGTGKTVSLSSTGTDGGNYTLSNQTTTTASVTPKALTVSDISANDKVYDGNSLASVNTGGAVFNGLVGGDDVTVSATGTFGDKNVAAGKTVTLSSSNGGADVGNYAITNQGTTTASITRKALAVSGVTADDKVYDGNTVAGVDTGSATISGIVSGDTVNIAGAFDTKNVGAGKTVNLSSAGTDGGNYTLSNQTTTTASVTPKALTVSGVTADDKVYDGNNVATVHTSGAVLGGLVSGDDVTLSASGAFSDKNAGATKTVSLSSTNGGADAGNYTITNQATTTASITPKSLAITANDDVRDAGTGYAGGNGVTYAGFVAGENAGNLQGQLAFGGNSQGAVMPGTYGIEPSGFSSGNYAIANIAGMLTLVSPVTPVPVASIGGSAGGSAGAAEKLGNRVSAASVEVAVNPSEAQSGLVVVWVPQQQGERGTGFSFTLPEALAGVGSDVRVSSIDGGPTSKWLHYDPQRRVFSADAVPRGALPWQEVATIDGKRVVIAVSERPQMTARN